MKEPIITISNFTGGATLNDKMGSENQFHTGLGLDFSSKPGFLSVGPAHTNLTYNDSEVLDTEFNCMLYAQKDGKKYFGGNDGWIYREEVDVIATISINDGGTGYEVDDVLTLTTEGTGGTVTVTSVDEGGVIDGVELTTGGIDYAVGTSDVTGGAGNDDAVINILTLEAAGLSLERVREMGSPILGMIEYKDYLYYADDTALGRFDFDSTWNNSFQTLNTATWHHMCVQALKLYVCNGQYVSSYDGTTWTAEALDLDTGWVTRCITPFGLTNVAIGINFGNVKSNVIVWNRTEISWNDTILVPENSIQAMLYDSGYLWIWGGSSSNIYVCAEGSRQAIKIWTFTREDPQDDFEVYPFAVAIRKGTVFFGLSDVDIDSYPKNPAAVYSFSVEPSKFALNIPIKKTGYNERYKSLAIMGTTNTLYAGFRDYISGGSEYNNLKREKTIDEVAPYSDTAEYETFYFTAPVNGKLITEQIGTTMDILPAGCNISLYYKKDAETDWTAIFSNFSTANSIEKKVEKIIEANRIKFKLELRGSTTTNNRPFVSSLYATGDVIPRT